MIEVRHSRGSYLVEFGNLTDLRKALPPDAFIFTDDNVAQRYRDFLEGRRVWNLTPGEQSKNLKTFARAHDWLASQKARRDAVLVAFGGGVVGDLAGFVAATYMRGVRLWQVPTSLLAQVDSSVGGKTGVDLDAGKNMVGAFYPPERVFVPLETLQTLPTREFINGMAEVWKYAFILDREMAEVLKKYPAVAGSEHLQSIVERCIWLKAEIVEADEHELTGQRAILNFGHTVGHALERVAEYRGILHGEAIAVGMVAEAILGEKLGITAKGTAKKIEKLLNTQGLPTRDPRLNNPEPLVSAMRSDKKADREGLAFSLLTEIGGCKLVRGVPEALVKRTLQDL